MKGKLAATGCLITSMVVSLCAFAWACTCEENWSAGSREEHSGCTAHSIYSRAPKYDVPDTLYRHHNAPFNRAYPPGADPPDSDIDCHQHTDCWCHDVDETSFTCTWTVEKWDNPTSKWVDCTEAVITSSNCNGCNVDTEDIKPGTEIKTTVYVNDTPGDYPYGDDPINSVSSGGQVVHAPYLSGFIHRTEAQGSPGCDTMPYRLEVHLTWKSSCEDGAAHIAHLDKVRFREVVEYDYEGQYTSGDPPMHDRSHSGGNCFTGESADPTKMGFLGSHQHLDLIYPLLGSNPDYHATFPHSGYSTSQCVAEQKYQWATGWPTAPAATDEAEDGVNWHGLTNHTISRYVKGDPNWYYQITKESGGFDCENDTY